MFRSLAAMPLQGAVGPLSFPSSCAAWLGDEQFGSTVPHPSDAQGLPDQARLNLIRDWLSQISVIVMES